MRQKKLRQSISHYVSKMEMKFNVITDEQVVALGVTPATCVDWVRDAFSHKDECILSPKISQKPTPDSFFNTMPCCIPHFNKMGVKVVSRLPNNKPPLKSTIMLFDLTTGELLTLMDANWITSMRTGAVAALAAKTFVNNFDTASFGLVGLGNISRAVLKCLFSQLPKDRRINIWLLKFMDEAEKLIMDFSTASNVVFHVAENKEELVRNTNALFSCVTVMNEQFLPPEKYPMGYTLIPVHTKGFQDCDLVFDHVFGDDIDHEREFKNFAKFRTFAEIKDVLSGKQPGRQSVNERIISYNVGIALHDIWFASRVNDMFVSQKDT